MVQIPGVSTRASKKETREIKISRINVLNSCFFTLHCSFMKVWNTKILWSLFTVRRITLSQKTLLWNSHTNCFKIFYQSSTSTAKFLWAAQLGQHKLSQALGNINFECICTPFWLGPATGHSPWPGRHWRHERTWSGSSDPPQPWSLQSDHTQGCLWNH